MIEKIKMNIVYHDVLIDNNDKFCIINNKKCEFASDDISNIIRIIRDWDSVYNNSKIIGENRYSIEVCYDGLVYKYDFNNSFPDNFLELVKYIGGIYDR